MGYWPSPWGQEGRGSIPAGGFHRVKVEAEGEVVVEVEVVVGVKGVCVTTYTILTT